MTTTVRAEVAAYVAAVRNALDDLPAEDADELVGGLEADLDDALTEVSGAAGGPVDPADLFGSPQAYATELRTAAGLPDRAESATPQGLAERLGDRGRRLRDGVTAQPWWPGVGEFLVTLRPVWWVTRAGVAAICVAIVMGLPALSTPFVALFVVLAVVSVELGRRGLVRRGRGWRAVIGAGNVLAAVLLLPVLTAIAPGSYGYQPIEAGIVPPANGLWLNGTEVRNVLPYDSAGRPLYGVQLFDENGQPLAVGDSARLPLWQEAATGQAQLPGLTEQGTQVWNAYPLRQTAVSRAGEADPVTGLELGRPAGAPRYPDPDLVRPPVLFAVPAPSPTAPPAASVPSPSASVSPAPSASPTLSAPAPATPSPTSTP